MAPVIRIYRSGELICQSEGIPGDTLLQHIISAGVFLDSPCGGNGKCGKCLVRLGADGEQALACRTRISGDMDIYLPDDTEMEIADGNAARYQDSELLVIAASESQSPGPPQGVAGQARNDDKLKSAFPLGAALDIGTTTVVLHLVNLETGGRIATASGVNAQRICGADVISRILYCKDNGHETLTRLIRGQVRSLILEACSTSGARAENIEYISIAANTIMQHLAAGLSPAGMGSVPFTPLSLFGGELPVWDELLAPDACVSGAAKVYYAPAVSAYVGGDVTAGMLAAGLEDTPGPAVYIDIGTNGEIALKAGDTYYCCATAAGPAFEGAEITMGMAAVKGAINHVRWESGLNLSVIGGGTAGGLCGSGLLDALAILVETGAVDGTGRMLDARDIGHGIAEHICKHDGQNAFRLTGDNGGVFITASDIRKLQLAKSAIAAGIQTLLRHTGVAQEHVKSFILAGGFGSFMDVQSAARIGLFPPVFLPVAETPGNTAGEGSALALCSEAARAALGSIRERCEYIELSTSPVWNELFIEHLRF